MHGLTARESGLGLLALVAATWLATVVEAAPGAPERGARPAGDESFIRGMTAMFPGTQSLEFCLKVEKEAGPPLDLWVLDLKGDRLPVKNARLVDADGKVVAPRQLGHWRVDRPAAGCLKLTVPPTRSAWRLWSAFHPFMVSIGKKLSLQVGEQGAAVFFRTPKPETVVFALKTVRGTMQARLLDAGGREIGRAVVSPNETILRGRSVSGVCRLNLRGSGIVEFSVKGVPPWAAFAPWDSFNPSLPEVKIRGATKLAPGQLLKLRAVATDPDGDVAEITWKLPSGRELTGPQLCVPVSEFEPFAVQAVVRDREGNTGAAQVQVNPPPPHMAAAGKALLVQAEDFTREHGGRVFVCDRGSNVGKMITKWQQTGHWVEWKFEIGRPGRYAIYARYATSGQKTRRRVILDGKTPGKAYESVAFSRTGGYGRYSAHWKVKKLGPPVQLTGGAHRLRMTNLGDGLALDYLAFVRTP